MSDLGALPPRQDEKGQPQGPYMGGVPQHPSQVRPEVAQMLQELAHAPDNAPTFDNLMRRVQAQLRAESEVMSQEFLRAVQASGLTQEFQAQEMAQLTDQQRRQQLAEINQLVNSNAFDVRTPESLGTVTQMLHSFNEATGQQYDADVQKTLTDAQYKRAKEADAQSLMLHAENTIVPMLKEHGFALTVGPAVVGGLLGGPTSTAGVMESELNRILDKAISDRFDNDVEIPGGPSQGSDPSVPQPFSIPVLKKELYAGRDPKEYEEFMRKRVLRRIMEAVQESGELTPSTAEQFGLALSTFAGGMAIPIPGLAGVKALGQVAKGSSKQLFAKTLGILGKSGFKGAAARGVATGVVAGGAQRALSEVALPAEYANRLRDIPDEEKRQRLEDAAKMSVAMETAIMAPLIGGAASVLSKPARSVAGALGEGAKLGAAMPAVTDASRLLQQVATDALAEVGIDSAAAVREAQDSGVLPGEAFWNPDNPEQMGAIRQIVSAVASGDRDEVAAALGNYAMEAGVAATAFGLMGVATRITEAQGIDQLSLRDRQEAKEVLDVVREIAGEAVDSLPDKVFEDAGVTREDVKALHEQLQKNVLDTDDDAARLSDEVGADEAESMLGRMELLDTFSKEFQAHEEARASQADEIAAKALSMDEAMKAAKETGDVSARDAMRSQQVSERLRGEAQQEALRSRQEALEGIQTGERGGKLPLEERLKQQMSSDEQRRARAQALAAARQRAAMQEPEAESLPTLPLADEGGGKPPTEDLPTLPFDDGGDDVGVRREGPWQNADDVDPLYLIPPEARETVGFWRSFREGEAGVRAEDMAKGDLDAPHRVVGIRFDPENPGLLSRAAQKLFGMDENTRLGMSTRAITEIMGLPSKFAPWIAPHVEAAMVRLSHTIKERGVQVRRMFDGLRGLKKMRGGSKPAHKGKRDVEQGKRIIERMLDQGPTDETWKRVKAAAEGGNERAQRVLDTAIEARKFFNESRDILAELDPTVRQWQKLVLAHEKRIIEIDRNYETLGKRERAIIKRSKTKIDKLRARIEDRKANWGLEDYFPHLLAGGLPPREGRRSQGQPRGGIERQAKKPGFLKRRKGVIEAMREMLLESGDVENAAAWERLKDPEEVMQHYAMMMARYAITTDLLETINPMMYGRLDFLKPTTNAEGKEVHEAFQPTTETGADRYVLYVDKDGSLVQMRNLGLHTGEDGKKWVVLAHEGHTRGKTPEQYENPAAVEAARRAEGMTVLSRFEAKEFLMTQRGGWTQELLQYANDFYGKKGWTRALKRIDAIEKYIQRTVFGGAVPEMKVKVGQGDGVLRRDAMKFSDAVMAQKEWDEKNFGAWSARLPRGISQLISANAMGLNPSSSWTVYVGGHLMNITGSRQKVWYPKGLGSAYRRVAGRLAGQAMSKAVDFWFDGEFQKRMAKRTKLGTEKGQVGTGLYAEFLAFLGENLRTSEEKLAKMKPEQADEIRLWEDAAVAALKSGIVDVSIFDETGNVRGLGKGKGDPEKWYAKMAVKFGKTGLRGIDLLKTAWMANVIIPENSVRMKGFMLKYAEAVKDGVQPERAAAEALHFVAGTQRSFQLASTPRWMDNPGWRIAGSLGRWAWLFGQRDLFGGRGIAQRTGRWARRWPYIAGAVYLGANLGNIADYLWSMVAMGEDEDEQQRTNMVRNLNRNVVNMVGQSVKDLPGAEPIINVIGDAYDIDPEAIQDLLEAPSPLFTPPAGTAGLRWIEYLFTDWKKAAAMLDPTQSKGVRNIQQWFFAEEGTDKFVTRRPGDEGRQRRSTDFTGVKQMMLDLMPGMAMAEHEAWVLSDIAYRMDQREKARSSEMGEDISEFANYFMDQLIEAPDSAKHLELEAKMDAVREDMLSMAERSPLQRRKLMMDLPEVWPEMDRLVTGMQKAIRDRHLTPEMRAVASKPLRSHQVDLLNTLMEERRATPAQVAQMLATENQDALAAWLSKRQSKMGVTIEDFRSGPFLEAFKSWVSTESVSNDQMWRAMQTLVDWREFHVKRSEPRRQPVHSGR